MIKKKRGRKRDQTHFINLESPKVFAGDVTRQTSFESLNVDVGDSLYKNWLVNFKLLQKTAIYGHENFTTYF